MLRTATLIALVIGALAFTGCGRRGSVEAEELKTENTRLSNQLNRLQSELDLVTRQRNEAREEVARLREQLQGASAQLKNFAGRSDLGPALEVTDDGGGVALKDDVAFARGSAELTEAGVAAMRQVAEIVNSSDARTALVFVVGHTDNTPVVRAETKAKFGDNWGLSAMRAASAVRALQAAGVNPDRLRGAFRGEHLPRASNSSNDGKAKNRRVEIRLALP